MGEVNRILQRVRSIGIFGFLKKKRLFDLLVLSSLVFFLEGKRKKGKK